MLNFTAREFLSQCDMLYLCASAARIGSLLDVMLVPNLVIVPQVAVHGHTSKRDAVPLLNLLWTTWPP